MSAVAPPPSARRRWLPALGLAVSVALLLGVGGVALLPADVTARVSGADRWLPADGAGTGVRLADGRDGYLEQAVVRGPGLIGLGTLGAYAAGGDPGTDARWLRLTVNPVDPTTAVVLLQVQDDDLGLTGVDVKGLGFTLDPAVSLRAGTQQGSWSQGATSGAYDATVAPATAPAPAGCEGWQLDVRRRAAAAIAVEVTVCRGAGVRALSATSGTTTFGFSTPADAVATVGGAGLGTLTLPATSWQRPESWQHESGLIYRNGGFDLERVAVNPSGRIATVVGDAVALVDLNTQDVVLLGARNGTVAAVPLIVRVHPGGSVRAVAAFTSLVVVATSERRLVGYELSGRRAWTTDLGDTVADQLLPDAGAQVIRLTTVAGRTLTVDATTGAIRWSDRGSGSVVFAPTSNGRELAVVDVDGQLRVLDAATGSLRWSYDDGRAADAVAIDDEVVVVARQGRVIARDLGTQQVRWAHRLRANRTPTMVAHDGTFVVATDAETVALDARTGGVRWRRPGARLLTVAGGRLFSSSDTRLSLLAADREVAGWDIQQGADAYGSCACAATASGVSIAEGSGLDRLR